MLVCNKFETLIVSISASENCIVGCLLWKTLIAFILTGLELLKTAIAKAGYTDKIKIGMDVAASGMIEHPSSMDFNCPCRVLGPEAKT